MKRAATIVLLLGLLYALPHLPLSDRPVVIPVGAVVCVLLACRVFPRRQRGRR